jgi:site-specific DNA-methyltransferase (adenine-specific)
VATSKEVFSMAGVIHQGDCIAGMNGLPAGSVHLAFADPPFNIGYKYDAYDDRREKADYLAWSRAWITAVHRVLREDGTFWLAIGDDYAAELKVLSQEIGFHSRSWVIWYYTFGVNCTNKFTRSHTHLLYFVKDPQRFTFRAHDAMNRVPSARELVYNDKRANPKRRLNDDTWILRPQDINGGFEPDEDTWYFPRVAGTFKERAGFHGCQMPEQLLGRIISHCSNEHDIVLDPFAGSASTLVTAKKLRRRAVGFELSKEYARQGRKRLAETQVGEKLVGAADAILTAPPTPKDVASLLPEVKASDLDFDREIKQAFGAVNDGWSADRLVADPDLNAAFCAACLERGLPGGPYEWNWRLLTIRKRGALKEFPTERTTDIDWNQCDQFLFASEIALRQLEDRYDAVLDRILCTPDLAAEFDGVAKELAPGFSPLQYRWGALKLRKEAKYARQRSESISIPRFKESWRGSDKFLGELRPGPGLYLISAKKPLYAGHAQDLPDRLGRILSPEFFARWGEPRDLRVQVRSFAGHVRELLGYQAKLVNHHRPKLNLRELVA